LLPLGIDKIKRVLLAVFGKAFNQRNSNPSTTIRLLKCLVRVWTQ
jgi:hypothetical protein